MEILVAILLFVFGGPLLCHYLDLDRFTPERCNNSSKAYNLAIVTLALVLLVAFCGALYLLLLGKLGLMYRCLDVDVLVCSVFYCYSPENRRR